MTVKKTTEEKFVELFRSQLDVDIPHEVKIVLSDMVRADLNEEKKRNQAYSKRSVAVRTWMKQKDLWVGEDI
jgi:hypothetical protein